MQDRDKERAGNQPVLSPPLGESEQAPQSPAQGKLSRVSSSSAACSPSCGNESQRRHSRHYPKLHSRRSSLAALDDRLVGSNAQARHGRLNLGEREALRGRTTPRLSRTVTVRGETH
jgi:hypothetical protein